MRFLAVIALWLVCALATVFFATVQHESAHERISVNMGCTSPKIHYSINGGEFFCEQYGNVTMEMQAKEEELHSLNEIVGYNVMAIILAIYLTAIIFILTVKTGGQQ